MTVKSQLRIFRNNAEIPLPPGSWRFIDMSMEPISEAYQAERAIDGTLVDLGYDGWDIYRISISCSDQSSPAIAGIWPGAVLTIYGIEDLIEPGPAVTLTREPVPGSIRACAADGRVIAEPEGRTLNVPGAAYFRYRPILSVMVTGFSTSSRELKADVRWSLSAEEVDASVAPPVVPTGPGLPDELVDALGGVVEEFEDASERKWRVHLFESTAALQILAPGEFECLVVAGGGGGGTGGGGGGAGGVLRATIMASAGDHTLVVGAGGAAGSGTDGSRNGYQGGNSTAFGITAIGGGGGRGATTYNYSRKNGGSGGGQFQNNDGPGSGVAYQGHPGGFGTTGAGWGESGGGGGAGGPGGNYRLSDESSDGGLGILIEDFFAEPRSFASGGATGNSGVAHPGGGGSSSTQYDGAVNTGGGGASTNGNGGSGFVAIRYRIS